MALVLDASVAACWFLPDEAHPIASLTRVLIEREDVRAPAIWWFEIRNVITLAERKRRLSIEQAAAAFRAIDLLPVQCEPLPDASAVEQFARRHRLTF